MSINTILQLSVLALACLSADAICADVGALDWTDKFVPYNNNDVPSSLGVDYYRNDPQRQHLHIARYPSPTPTPVFFFAHANGGDVENLGRGTLDLIEEAGYSLISWESVTRVSDEEDLLTCLDDFEAVWAWFLTNAEQYNLDVGKVVIGGKSRGSMCSFPMAHSAKPNIIGSYMNAALPIEAFIDTFVDMVTAQSPPLFLVYGPFCPKPILQTCTAGGDIHNPKNGQLVIERYDELGLGDIATLVDGKPSEGPDGQDDLFYFPAFAATLAGGGPAPTPAPPSISCAATLEELCSDSTTSMQCRDCARENKAALEAASCTTDGVKALCTGAAPSAVEEEPTQSMRSDALPQSVKSRPACADGSIPARGFSPPVCADGTSPVCPDGSVPVKPERPEAGTSEKPERPEKSERPKGGKDSNKGDKGDKRPVCADESRPSCADGSEPTKNHGSPPMCDDGDNPVCADGSAPEKPEKPERPEGGKDGVKGGKGGKGDKRPVCADESKPSCADGSEPINTGRGSPPVCADGVNSMCADGSAPVKPERPEAVTSATRQTRGNRGVRQLRGRRGVCADESTPVCADESDPIKTRGSPPMCADGANPVCTDGSAPVKPGGNKDGKDGKGGKGDKRPVCADESRPSCADGSEPIKTRGSPCICADGASPMCADGSSPTRPASDSAGENVAARLNKRFGLTDR